MTTLTALCLPPSGTVVGGGYDFGGGATPNQPLVETRPNNTATGWQVTADLSATVNMTVFAQCVP